MCDSNNLNYLSDANCRRSTVSFVFNVLLPLQPQLIQIHIFSPSNYVTENIPISPDFHHDASLMLFRFVHYSYNPQFTSYSRRHFQDVLPREETD